MSGTKPTALAIWCSIEFPEVCALAQYDAETLMILRNALDEAWAALPDNRKSGTQKSDMAQRILKQAANGVRDPVRLQASALVSPVDEPSSSIGSGPHHEASADQTMEEYIHQENLALFKKRLEAVHTDAEREVLLRLLADEEAKEPPPKIGKHQ